MPRFRHAVYHVLSWLALSLPAAALADPPSGYDFTDFNSGLARAQAEQKPVFVYFGRYGCAWCDHVNRKTFADPELRKLYSARYILVYVDAEGAKRLRLPSGERVSEAEYGARLGAFATPLFVYLTPEGRQVAKIPGFKTVADFKDYDRYISGRHYERQTLAEFLGSAR
jgi:thioredoxin-related protein